jgi:hypothetical protein
MRHMQLGGTAAGRRCSTAVQCHLTMGQTGADGHDNTKGPGSIGMGGGSAYRNYHEMGASTWCLHLALTFQLAPTLHM